MKKLTKYLTLLLTSALLVACSGKPNETPTTWQDQLKNPSKIVIGISPDYPPFESLTTSGEIEGFDIDMINTLISYLESEIALEFAQMEFSTIVSAVQSGQVDIGLSGFTYDADRDVIFSTPYLASAQVVLVKKDSSITTIADLANKTVGVQLGTTGAEAASEIADVKEVVLFNDTLIGLESLKNNIIDAFVTDLAVAKNYVTTGEYEIIDETLIDESVSIIVKNGNDLLADKINELIQQFIESDAYQTLIDKWGV